MARVAMIGFGEAATALAPGLNAVLTAFDPRVERPAVVRVARAGSDAEALADADAVLSLVTADQALAAARSGAAHVRPGTLWFDMNSVAPDTKRTAARAIAAAGGRYVDVAVMAPVVPLRTGVPMLVSGPYAQTGAASLRAIGFASVRVVEGDVGQASSIKMIRSVMVKGIEALTAECVRAADRAGVLGEVLSSLDAGPAPADWASRADYNLDRMLAHGLRRAAELEEVAKTLDALGTGSAMTRSAMPAHRAIGMLGAAPPAGLAAKLALLAAVDRGLVA